MAVGDIKVVQENSGGTYDEIVLEDSGVDVGTILTNPMTASGDIIYGGTSGAPTRLAKGSDGQVLKLASGVPSWAAGGGGGLANVVEDTTPQLGGTLDAQENDIDNVGDIIHDDATASDWTLKNEDQDKDIIFSGNDGGSQTTIMKLDVSEGQLSGIIKATAGVLGTATPGTDYLASMAIWTAISGTYASASTWTFTGTDKDVNLIQLSLFTCTDSAGTTRKIGYVKSSVNSTGTITVTVFSNLALASGDKDFKVAYNQKVTFYEKLVTIPGEQILDASYSQGMFYLNTRVSGYLLCADAAVITPATGSGAVVWNIYRGSVAMYAIAPDLTTNATLVEQIPSMSLGGSTTRYDITNPSGSTFRYTYDGTGTNPAITATNPTPGDTVIINAQNFNAGNNGTFVVTGAGTNYFEVTNASGVAENDKTIGTGTIIYKGLVPCSITAADNLSLRITNSAGTAKAADYQCRFIVIPTLIWTAF